MKGMEFPEATNKLLPPEGQEDTVYALPVWRHPDGNMVISKWKLSWRERLHCLFEGHIWFECMGGTHPPITLETEYPFERDSVPWGIGIRRSIIFVMVFLLALAVGTGILYYEGLLL